MKGVIILFKKYWAPIVAILLFLFLCIYNLSDQYMFNNDPARDTLQSLRILRSRDITIIGPPLSLGLNSMREIYFSSLIYYITAFMLLISNNAILPTVLIISLINASGIIPLYVMLKKRGLTIKESFLLLLLYITNPEVVLYSRILWNPSPQIGLGIWGLYFLNKSAIVFGIIAGIAIYFHYFSIALILFGLIFYSKEKQYRKLVLSLISFGVTLSPFLLFELKNKFYLTQSFIYNLQNSPSETVSDQKYKMFLEIPAYVLGLINDPFNTAFINVGAISILVGLAIWIVLLMNNRKNIYFILVIISTIFTGFASSIYVRTQYMFIAIGAIVAYCINVKSKLAKVVIVLLIIIQSINTIYSINQKPRLSDASPFPLITELEEVNQTIQMWHRQNATFNITENITGDARAMYLRFFLERDTVSGLQNELTYDGLQELYVITPSLEKTEKEKRWEFTATKNLKLTEKKQIGKFLLLKFEQIQKS